MNENGLATMVQQAKAADLSAVSQVGGVGALVAVQSGGNIVPVRPKHLTDEQNVALQAAAGQFVDQIQANAADWRLGNLVLNLGRAIMEESQAHVSLYDRKMGQVLKVVSSGDSPVGKDIMAIKLELDKVNPAMVAKTPLPFKEKMWRLFSRTVSRLPKAEEVLKVIAERRETVSSTINGIRVHLMQESDQVMQDAADLAAICDQLKALQPRLQEEIYRGQLIWQGLTALIPNIQDPRQKEAVTTLGNDLAMAVVDLQTIDNANLQTRFGGEMMIRNSGLVQRLVQRTNMILSSAVANALAVRVAAAQQLQTLKHLQMVQSAATETMKDTAKTVGAAAIESARMGQQMVIDINALQEACDTYEKAFDTYVQISRETMEVAAKSSGALTVMSEKFRARADALTNRRQPEDNR